MIMSKQIIPCTYLEYCPNCSSKLILSNTIGGTPTTCLECDYQELAGNAVIITFISACISNFGDLYNVDTVFLKGNEFSLRECMEGNGLLPLFIDRVSQIQLASGFYEQPELRFQLKNIPDQSGLLLTRVSIINSSIDIANTLLFLGDALHNVMELTKSLDHKYYENQICLDSFPGITSDADIKQTSQERFNNAIQAASMQQVLGN